MNAAQQLLDGWVRCLGVICLGGQVLVENKLEPHNPGTPPRRHKRTNRKASRLKARWEEACRRHQLAQGVAYPDIEYV